MGGGLIALAWNRLALRADVTCRRRLTEFITAPAPVFLTLGVGLLQ